MALLFRNARPYLLPLLRGSRPTGALVGRAFSSGSNNVSFRSPASLGSRNDEASGKGRSLDGGTAASTTRYNDTDGVANAIREELEDFEDGFGYEDADYAFAWGEAEMAQDIMVTFLGTSSGGGPTKTRNCSSLVVDMLGDGSLWSTFYPSNQPMSYHIPHRLSLFLACDLNES